MQEEVCTVYVCDDGARFLNLRDAEIHEAGHVLKQWAEEERIGRGGEWNADMVIASMRDRAGYLWPALKRLWEGSGS